MKNPQQVTFRPTEEDATILNAIHGHLRRIRRDPFITRTDAIRFALQETQSALASQRQDDEER